VAIETEAVEVPTDDRWPDGQLIERSNVALAGQVAEAVMLPAAPTMGYELTTLYG